MDASRGAAQWTWAIGVVLLAGGFGAGYVVGGGGRGGARRRRPRRSRPAPGHPPRASPSRAEEAPVVLESARAAALEPIRRALGEVAPPEVPTGTGVVTGTVKTTDGAPLPGVEITLVPREKEERAPAWAWRGDGKAPDLPSAVKDFVDRFRRIEATRRTTTTGADGAYRAEGLADLEYGVSATLAGWQIRSDGSSRAKPDGKVDFRAQAVSRVEFAVTLPDGTEPAGASLVGQRIDQPGGPAILHLEARPADDPPRARDLGDHRVRRRERRAPDGGAGPGVGRGGRRAADGATRPRRPDGPAREGRLPEGGAARGGMRGSIAIAPVPPGRGADPALLAGSGQSQRSWSRDGGSDAQVATFPDLPPGRYLVGLSRDWGAAPTVTKEVDVGTGATDVTLDVPPLRRDEYVVVRVLGPDGKPIPNARVMGGFTGPSGASSGPVEVIDREDGSKWALHHHADAMPAEATAGAVSWWLEAWAEGYGKKRSEYRRDGAASVDFRFDEPGTIEVTVAGASSGASAGRFRVGVTGGAEEAMYYVHDRGTRDENRVDASGRARIRGVQPGEYDLLLFLSGEMTGLGGEVARQKVTVRSGTTEARMTVPPLYEVTIEGLQGTGWVTRREQGRRFQRSLRATADGRAVVDGLPAGEYQAGSGDRRATFRVPGATTVRLEKPPPPEGTK